jgi:hypothetical protein
MPRSFRNTIVDPRGVWSAWAWGRLDLSVCEGRCFGVCFGDRWTCLDAMSRPSVGPIRMPKY